MVIAEHEKNPQKARKLSKSKESKARTAPSCSGQQPGTFYTTPAPASVNFATDDDDDGSEKCCLCLRLDAADGPCFSYLCEVGSV